jgi:O-antigen ligase
MRKSYRNIRLSRLSFAASFLYHGGMARRFAEVLGFAGRETLIDRLLWGALLLVAASMIFSLALLQIAAVAVLLLWLVSAFRRRSFRLITSPIDLPFLLFFAARVLTVPFAVDVAASAEGLRIEVVFYIMYFALRDTIRAEGRDRVILVAVLAAAAVCASGIGIAKYLLHIADRASSTTAGYYTLGLFLTGVVPLTFPALMADSGRVKRTMLGAVTLIIVAGILFTFDRLHWIALALQVGIAGLLWNRRFLLLAVVVFLLAVLLVPPLQQRFLELVQFQGHLSDRDVLLRGAAQVWLDHPITGFGMRSFHAVFPLQNELADKFIGGWHNDFIQVYIESGIVTLIPFVWLFVAIGVTGIKAYRQKTRTIEDRWMILACLLALLVFLFPGGCLDVIGGQLFRLCLAMLVVAVEAQRTQRTNEF